MTELLQLHIIRPVNISFLVHYQKCNYAVLSAAVSALFLSSIWNHVWGSFPWQELEGERYLNDGQTLGLPKTGNFSCLNI